MAKEVAKATTGMGLNKFAKEAPVLLVISEKPYNKSAALGAKIKGNDYRSIDIGIMVAYLTSQAISLGLETCILGWFDEDKIKNGVPDQQQSFGIEKVFINGQMVLSEGMLDINALKTTGRALKV